MNNRSDKSHSDNDNIDQETVSSFGSEWGRFNQSSLSEAEHKRLFDAYFDIFPWDRLPDNAEGFDMGCGSGRWANLVAPRVGTLHCVDPASEALDVAKSNLAGLPNVKFYEASTQTVAISQGSQDFGYSLGVLHHVPDTMKALERCVSLLKPGAPFLLYLYYRFDNRPLWFRLVWRLSDMLRMVICKLPDKIKVIVSDLIALAVYLPLARFSWICERLGLSLTNAPLYYYRNTSFYTMRTDARDRFGTPLEKRFTKDEMKQMMENAGLEHIEFSKNEPYWVAVGFKT